LQIPRISRRAVLAGAALLASGPARADATWPNRPIRMVVPFPPGSSPPGVIGRALGDQMALALGQPVVVDHKPGATGTLGVQAAALAPADGYTIVLADRGALGLMPALNPKLGYDPLKSLAHIGIVADSNFVLVANPDLGVRTMAEFVALVKAKPGQLNYGSFGVGGIGHLNMELLSQGLGLQMQHVPYKNTVEAMAAVAAGEVQAALSGQPAVLGLAREGKLRPLVIGAPARSPLLPDVPTLAEAGLSADLLPPTFFSLAAPAGTPAPVLARLHTEMKAALADAEVQRRLDIFGLTPVGGTAAEVEAIIRRDLVEFGALIRKLGLTLQ
jgi:tripartite-type tricarboxylate transporter receptor subunit TctC